MKERGIIIKCPLCGQRVGYYDGKGQIDVYTACRMCRVGVLYTVKGRFTLIRPYPDISTAAAKRIV